MTQQIDVDAFETEFRNALNDIRKTATSESNLAQMKGHKFSKAAIDAALKGEESYSFHKKGAPHYLRANKLDDIVAAIDAFLNV